MLKKIIFVIDNLSENYTIAKTDEWNVDFRLDFFNCGHLLLGECHILLGTALSSKVSARNAFGAKI
ncbi:hypothetical protein PYR74_23475 [Acinetobacter bereziniae]|nr:hypothetical protein PYR74_23475 [Acinetobacter bereziniae]